MTHIAVVGAGIAGLGAALTLQDAGLSCTIYEASHRLGGRMRSDALTWADGMVSEWCGEFILSALARLFLAWRAGFPDQTRSTKWASDGQCATATGTDELFPIFPPLLP
jgi:phytoene dehydrogenase-like protein